MALMARPASCCVRRTERHQRTGCGAGWRQTVGLGAAWPFGDNWDPVSLGVTRVSLFLRPESLRAETRDDWDVGRADLVASSCSL